ncbi:unnamed protein product [Protopolystoma xenopodis]|uniref:Uncharacterized protein n=1 Tax=Protopolystoma xenopodis TaxID=117903 RepID=A0A448X156_9PLAT|nr:unnamed protein product [Protopolystoma xenopodis]
MLITTGLLQTLAGHLLPNCLYVLKAVKTVDLLGPGAPASPPSLEGPAELYRAGPLAREPLGRQERGSCGCTKDRDQSHHDCDGCLKRVKSRN